MRKRAQVKICGITRVRDAELAADLGADLLGLNFYPASPRYLESARAREIAAAVGGRITLVGIFVNHPVERVQEVASEVGLDLVQLHGDEGPDEVFRLAGRAIKVFRVGGRASKVRLAEYPQAWGFLFDWGGGRRYGGSGIPWDYGAIADLATEKPVLVAGGIGPDNVRRALRRSGATGVDVCSRVEERPGVKDPELLTRLFEEVEHADA